MKSPRPRVFILSLSLIYLILHYVVIRVLLRVLRLYFGLSELVNEVKLGHVDSVSGM